MLCIVSHMGHDPKMAQKFDLIETKVILILLGIGQHWIFICACIPVLT